MDRVSISCDVSRFRVPRGRLERAASRLLSREGGRTGRVEVILSDDRTLRRLNRRFRKKDRPTDVLSFRFGDPGFLGEMYLSLPRIRRASESLGLPFPAEVWRVMVHGLFHLLGFTHGKAMRRREAAWLGGGGLP